MPFGLPPIIIGPTTQLPPKDVQAAAGAGAFGVAGAAASAVGGIGGAVQSVGEFLAFITDPANLIRLAEAIAGGVLVLTGIYFVFSTTKTGQEVVKTTGAAVGAAAKGAAA